MDRVAALLSADGPLETIEVADQGEAEGGGGARRESSVCAPSQGLRSALELAVEEAWHLRSSDAVPPGHLLASSPWLKVVSGVGIKEKEETRRQRRRSETDDDGPRGDRLARTSTAVAESARGRSVSAGLTNRPAAGSAGISPWEMAELQKNANVSQWAANERWSRPSVAELSNRWGTDHLRRYGNSEFDGGAARSRSAGAVPRVFEGHGDGEEESEAEAEALERRASNEAARARIEERSRALMQNHLRLIKAKKEKDAAAMHRDLPPPPPLSSLLHQPRAQPAPEERDARGREEKKPFLKKRSASAGRPSSILAKQSAASSTSSSLPSASPSAEPRTAAEPQMPMPRVLTKILSGASPTSSLPRPQQQQRQQQGAEQRSVSPSPSPSSSPKESPSSSRTTADQSQRGQQQQQQPPSPPQPAAFAFSPASFAGSGHTVQVTGTLHLHSSGPAFPATATALPAHLSAQIPGQSPYSFSFAPFADPLAPLPPLPPLASFGVPEPKPAPVITNPTHADEPSMGASAFTSTADLISSLRGSRRPGPLAGVASGSAPAPAPVAVLSSLGAADADDEDEDDASTIDGKEVAERSRSAGRRGKDKDKPPSTVSVAVSVPESKLSILRRQALDAAIEQRAGRPPSGPAAAAAAAATTATMVTTSLVLLKPAALNAARSLLATGSVPSTAAFITTTGAGAGAATASFSLSDMGKASALRRQALLEEEEARKRKEMRLGERTIDDAKIGKTRSPPGAAEDEEGEDNTEQERRQREIANQRGLLQTALSLLGNAATSDGAYRRSNFHLAAVSTSMDEQAFSTAASASPSAPAMLLLACPTGSVPPSAFKRPLRERAALSALSAACDRQTHRELLSLAVRDHSFASAKLRHLRGNATREAVRSLAAALASELFAPLAVLQRYRLEERRERLELLVAQEGRIEEMIEKGYGAVAKEAARALVAASSTASSTGSQYHQLSSALQEKELQGGAEFIDAGHALQEHQHNSGNTDNGSSSSLAEGSLQMQRLQSLRSHLQRSRKEQLVLAAEIVRLRAFVFVSALKAHAAYQRGIRTLVAARRRIVAMAACRVFLTQMRVLTCYRKVKEDAALSLYIGSASRRLLLSSFLQLRRFAVFSAVHNRRKALAASLCRHYQGSSFFRRARAGLLLAKADDSYSSASYLWARRSLLAKVFMPWARFAHERAQRRKKTAVIEQRLQAFGQRAKEEDEQQEQEGGTQADECKQAREEADLSVAPAVAEPADNSSKNKRRGSGVYSSTLQRLRNTNAVKRNNKVTATAAETTATAPLAATTTTSVAGAQQSGAGHGVIASSSPRSSAAASIIRSVSVSASSSLRPRSLGPGSTRAMKPTAAPASKRSLSVPAAEPAAQVQKRAKQQAAAAVANAARRDALKGLRGLVSAHLVSARWARGAAAVLMLRHHLAYQSDDDASLRDVETEAQEGGLNASFATTAAATHALLETSFVAGGTSRDHHARDTSLQAILDHQCSAIAASLFQEVTAFHHASSSAPSPEITTNGPHLAFLVYRQVLADRKAAIVRSEQAASAAAAAAAAKAKAPLTSASGRSTIASAADVRRQREKDKQSVLFGSLPLARGRGKVASKDRLHRHADIEVASGAPLAASAASAPSAVHDAAALESAPRKEIKTKEVATALLHCAWKLWPFERSPLFGLDDEEHQTAADDDHIARADSPSLLLEVSGVTAATNNGRAVAGDEGEADGGGVAADDALEISGGTEGVTTSLLPESMSTTVETAVTGDGSHRSDSSDDSILGRQSILVDHVHRLRVLSRCLAAWSRVARRSSLSRRIDALWRKERLSTALSSWSRLFQQRVTGPEQHASEIARRRSLYRALFAWRDVFTAAVTERMAREAAIEAAAREEQRKREEQEAEAERLQREAESQKQVQVQGQEPEEPQPSQSSAQPEAPPPPASPAPAREASPSLPVKQRPTIDEEAAQKHIAALRLRRLLHRWKAAALPGLSEDENDDEEGKQGRAPSTLQRVAAARALKKKAEEAKILVRRASLSSSLRRWKDGSRQQALLRRVFARAVEYHAEARRQRRESIGLPPDEGDLEDEGQEGSGNDYNTEALRCWQLSRALLQRWRDAAASALAKKKRREMRFAADAFYRQGKLLSSMQVWKRKARLVALFRRLESVVEKRRARLAFAAWHQAAVEINSRLAPFLHRWRREKPLRAALDCWVVFVGLEKRAKKAVLRRFIRRWAASLRALQEKENEVETLRQRSLVTKSFNSWARLKAKKAYSEDAAQFVSRRKEERVKRKLLEAWKTAAVVAERKRPALLTATSAANRTESPSSHSVVPLGMAVSVTPASPTFSPFSSLLRASTNKKTVAAAHRSAAKTGKEGISPAVAALVQLAASASDSFIPSPVTEPLRELYFNGHDGAGARTTAEDQQASYAYKPSRDERRYLAAPEHRYDPSLHSPGTTSLIAAATASATGASSSSSSSRRHGPVDPYFRTQKSVLSTFPATIRSGSTAGSPSPGRSGSNKRGNGHLGVTTPSPLPLPGSRTAERASSRQRQKGIGEFVFSPSLAVSYPGPIMAAETEEDEVEQQPPQASPMLSSRSALFLSTVLPAFAVGAPPSAPESGFGSASPLASSYPLVLPADTILTPEQHRLATATAGRAASPSPSSSSSSVVSGTTRGSEGGSSQVSGEERKSQQSDAGSEGGLLSPPLSAPPNRLRSVAKPLMSATRLSDLPDDEDDEDDEDDDDEGGNGHGSGQPYSALMRQVLAMTATSATATGAAASALKGRGASRGQLASSLVKSMLRGAPSPSPASKEFQPSAASALVLDAGIVRKAKTRLEAAPAIGVRQVEEALPPSSERMEEEGQEPIASTATEDSSEGVSLPLPSLTTPFTPTAVDAAAGVAAGASSLSPVEAIRYLQKHGQPGKDDESESAGGAGDDETGLMPLGS